MWEDLTGDGNGSAIKGQVFTASGIPSGEAFTINTATADDQTAPTVTALANGDALVTWTDHDGATSDIYSQVINLQSYVGDGSAETVHGGSLGDTLDGGAGADVLYGNGGNDVFANVTLDDLDDDIFDGGSGTDTLDLDDYVPHFGPPVLLGANGTLTSIEVINLHGPTAGAGINNVELAIPLANSSSDDTVTVNGALAQDFIFGDRINNADISLYLNGGGGNDSSMVAPAATRSTAAMMPTRSKAMAAKTCSKAVAQATRCAAAPAATRCAAAMVTTRSKAMAATTSSMAVTMPTACRAEPAMTSTSSTTRPTW